MKKVILMLAVAAMASCSKSDVESRPDLNIKTRSNAVEAVAGTRVYEGQIAAANTLTAKVLASKTQGQYGANLYAEGTMTFNDQTTAVAFDAGATGSTFYPANGDKIYLFGLYPSDAAWTVESDNSSFTCALDGKTDLMVAKELETSKADAPSSYKQFVFDHILTRLDVSVVAEDQAAIDAWGEVTGIELTDVASTSTAYVQPNNNCKVPVTYAGTDVSVPTANRPAYTATAVSGVTMPFYFYDGNGATVADKYTTDLVSATKTIALPNAANSESALRAAYSVIAPVTIKTLKAFKLKVTTTMTDGTVITKDGVTVELVDDPDDSIVNNGNTAGKYYSITLTFKSTEIKASATVNDWVEGVEGTGDVQ